MDENQETPKENLRTDIVTENNEFDVTVVSAGSDQGSFANNERDPLVSNHEPETKVSEVNA